MRTLAITSGKGGVGKSALAANLGVALGQSGLNVVLFDADLALANLDVMLGAKPTHTLQHVLSNICTASEAVTSVGPGLGLIAGGSAVGTLMRSGPKRIGKFLSQLAELEPSTDVLIFDTSAGIDSKVTTFCRIADDILLLTTPDPASVTDAYATAKVIFRQKPEARIRLVINRVESDSEGQAIFEKLSGVTQSFLDREIEFAGCIREDAAAAECVRRRTSFVQAHPALPASQDVTRLAKSLRESIKKDAGGSFASKIEAMAQAIAAPAARVSAA